MKLSLRRLFVPDMVSNCCLTKEISLCQKIYTGLILGEYIILDIRKLKKNETTHCISTRRHDVGNIASPLRQSNLEVPLAYFFSFSWGMRLVAFFIPDNVL